MFTTRRILFIYWFVTLVLIITKIRVVTSLFTSSLNRSAIREKTRLGGRVANANERDKSHDKSNDRSKSSSQKIYKEKQFNKRINTLTHELSKSCYSRAVPGRPARAQPTCSPLTHMCNLPKRVRGESAFGNDAGELGASPK